MEAEAVILFLIGVVLVLAAEFCVGMVLLQGARKGIRKEFFLHWLCEVIAVYLCFLFFRESKGLVFKAVSFDPNINLALIGFFWFLSIYFMLSLIMKIIEKK